MPKFVNVYLEDQGYGGPEEGGWYYTYGEYLRTAIVETEEEAEKLKEYFENGEYSNEGRPSMYHSNSQGEYRVRIEDQPGRSYPEERPYYE